jgi:SagB-type dehydrogenase family enzyme
MLGDQTRLPQPRQDGAVALERCIARRRSVRRFPYRTLSLDQLGQLLWAAQGVTSFDGKRAVASAGALYPLEVYVAAANVASLPAGVHHYLPVRHALVQTAPPCPRGEIVDAALGQGWVADAPVLVCIAAVFERTTAKYGTRGRGFVYIEAGLAAESLSLQAVALGLGATIVGAFDDDRIKRLMTLGGRESPLLLLPVGAR